MDERTKHLLDLCLAQDNNDVEKKIEHLELITNSLFILTQSLFENKQEIKYHQRELEGKFFRFGFANHSLINLIKGNHFILINQKAHIGDIFSISSVTRMQIESYLITYYLFFDNNSDSEKDFRYDIYRLHGLQKQLSFASPTEFPDKKENLDKINSEINEVIQNIKGSEIYLAAAEKKKQEYLQPRFAKLVKSEELFKSSEIESSRIGDLWQLYSNYAHSEYISDRQYNTAYKIEKSIIDNCSIIIFINSVLTSKMILNFKKLFKSVEKKYSELSSTSQHYIEFWGTIKIN